MSSEIDLASFARAFANVADVVMIARPSGEIVFANRPFEATSELDAARRDVVKSGVAVTVDVTSPSSPPTTTRFTVSPMLDDGHVTHVVFVGADVTARAKTEARLRGSVALLVDTQGVAHLGTWEWDVSEPTAFWSDELYRIYGETPETYTPSYEEYLKKVHPDDRGYVIEATKRVFEQHQPYSHDERIFRPDGTMRYLHTWAHAITDDAGKLVKLVGVCQDITERKVTELALLEHERALRQSHKLEAIGRLAGGIAHDFNNLLSVVVGHSSLLQRKFPQGDPTRARVDEITAVGLQAARLTQQLLAFTREQVIHKEPLDLTRVVSDLGRMLQRVIGEDIELDMRLGDDRVAVLADEGQMEQVVLNLAVNARDAMPRGGRLTIEIARADEATIPAELDATKAHVVLMVSDTGVGMSEAVLSRIFEPFFSTKDDDKGTGLGLSTVYGIVKQTGGSIAVTSSPDRGSRFAVFLPVTDRSTSERVRDESALDTYRGTGTVLVVEDQAPLRSVMKHLLEGIGFDVVDAADPIEALALLREKTTPIRLLLTDVVMPRMNGRELAETLTAEHPGTRVLYVSGYPADDLVRRGASDGTVTLLRKPFTSTQLARAVRDVLSA